MVGPDNPQFPRNRKGGVPHILNLPVKKGLRRIKSHRVPGVNSNRIHVLNHREHHHRARGIPLHDHFDFLVPRQALLNQHLFSPGLTQAALDCRCQFPLVMDNPPGTIALWQDGANDYRVAQLAGFF